MGLHQMIVDVIIDADEIALKGGLDSTSRDLSVLIGKPTTTLTEAVASALPVQYLNVDTRLSLSPFDRKPLARCLWFG